MKKIILSLCLVLSTTAYAGGNYGGGHSYNSYNTKVNNYHGGGYNRGYWNNGAWVAPLVVGGFIGAAVVASPYYAPPVVEVVPVPAPVPVYTNTVQTNNQCPYPDRPIYNRIYTTDRFGNNIQVDQFVGCR